ncbi:MAG TPA: DUF1634 domain-containing protein [Vicinamibacterales bacterium]|nr:DUF1634 domain-containing protein [Vicinamibacterales bacterium]
MRPRDFDRLERQISVVLTVGLALSGTALGVGLVLALLGIGGGDLLLGFGLMVLLFIPVARIAASFEDAIRRRDALLALCTALVLLTMTVTLIYTMRS